MKKLRSLLCICILLCVSSLVSANDMNPPAWRGLPGSTVQGWEFGTSSKTPTPDLLHNDYGIPYLTVIPTKPWYSSWGGLQGVWHLSGAITAQIPNNPVENLYKLIQIQLTWASEDGTSTPCVSVEAWLTGVDIDPVPEDDIVFLGETSIQLGATGVSGAGEYWYHTTYLFQIIPNPAVELITVGSAVMVDELIIDTICVPEPATVFVLSIGVLSLLKRKKR